MIPFLVRRSRWMVLGWAARKVGRIGLQKSVDRATAGLQSNLPAPVTKAMDKLPGDAARAGGAAIVVGRGAQSAGSAVRSAAATGRRLTQSSRQGTADASRSVSDRVHELRDEIAIESDQARRRIKSDMLRETEGEGAALDALLDLRNVEDEPLPTIPDEVRQGRRRAHRALAAAPVNRVRRSYRQAHKPWDRPPRR